VQTNLGVPASEIVEAPKRIKQLEKMLWVERLLKMKFSKKPLSTAKPEGGLRDRTSFKGRAVRVVYAVLGVEHSYHGSCKTTVHVAERRRALPNSDDSAVLADIGIVIKDLCTHGYRCVWGALSYHGVNDRVHRSISLKKGFIA